jgi:hypothetical protein
MSDFPLPRFSGSGLRGATNACNARCTVCATDHASQAVRHAFDLFRKSSMRPARARNLPFLHGDAVVLGYWITSATSAGVALQSELIIGSRLDAEIS